MIRRRTSHQQQRGISEPAALAAGFAFGIDPDIDLEMHPHYPAICDRRSPLVVAEAEQSELR